MINLIMSVSEWLSIKSTWPTGLLLRSLFSMLFLITFPCNTGVPGRPEITGFTKPAMEGDIITLTCTTSGSKPAANIRWFRNDKEVQGKHVVWISHSIVSSVTTCILLETSLLSSHSAAAFLCAHILALFHCPGVGGGYWCHDLPGSQPALPLLLEAVQMLLDCSIAVHISLPDRGVDVQECLLLIQVCINREPCTALCFHC